MNSRSCGLSPAFPRDAHGFRRVCLRPESCLSRHRRHLYEEDPDRLAELFQLDHLATRMRRNDENLLVLAGADSTRVQREPAPLMGRAPRRAVRGRALHPRRVRHATATSRSSPTRSTTWSTWSPSCSTTRPRSPRRTRRSVVGGPRTATGALMVEIADRGIGMSADELVAANYRLADPASVDVSTSRRMGERADREAHRFTRSTVAPFGTKGATKSGSNIGM